MIRTGLVVALPVLMLIMACAVADDGGGSESSAPPPVESDDGDSEAALGMKVLERGSYGKMAEAVDSSRRRAPFVEVATNGEELRGLWSQYIREGEPPDVSFDRSIVVFLLMPPQPTGGYGVEPEGVSVDGRVIEVDATLHQPDERQIVTQAFTAPFAVIEIEGIEVEPEKVVWMNQGRALATKTID